MAVEPTVPPSANHARQDGRALKGKRGIPRLIAACGYSIDGLAAAWRHESAFRQELVLFVVLSPVAVSLPFPVVERVVLILVLLLVLIVELLNSSIEAAVDRDSLQIDALAKRAKDAGSAAVMLSVLAAAGTWIGLLASHFL